MKNCPTSNMNRSQMWGFEVSHIITALGALATSNVVLNIVGAPLILSWALGFITIVTLRVVSHGQKNGHLELLGRYVLEPHLYLGHKGRSKTLAQKKDKK